MDISSQLRSLTVATLLSVSLIPGFPGLASAAHGQPPPKVDDSRQMTFGSAVEVRWVLVPVVVKKRVGYARDLKAHHFELLVDGRTVLSPEFESTSDAPFSAVYLQDLSGSIANGGKLKVSRRILGCFLALAQPADHFSIATFGGGRLEIQEPSTSDAAQLRSAAKSWEPYGTTALHDAVAWLPDLSSEDQANKRVAILVTDGIDNASTLPPEEARTIMRKAELPVYVIGLGTGSPFVLNPEGDKLHRFADVLNLLAYHSGGRYETVADARQVGAVCSSIVRDLRHQYLLSFPTASDGEDRYRTIEVRVRGRGREATYRRGYVGGLPASPLAR